ncbi:hypothetical protein N2152v2_008462 [Parachlorella kessleri]
METASVLHLPLVLLGLIALASAVQAQVVPPAAGTVLQLRVELEQNMLEFSLVWGQSAFQQELGKDGSPAGGVFNLGNFEAQDGLDWLYSDGDSVWCKDELGFSFKRQTVVHYTVNSAATAHSLDRVREPTPCFFEFYVSGPSSQPAEL